MHIFVIAFGIVIGRFKYFSWFSSLLILYPNRFSLLTQSQKWNEDQVVAVGGQNKRPAPLNLTRLKPKGTNIKMHKAMQHMNVVNKNLFSKTCFTREYCLTFERGNFRTNINAHGYIPHMFTHTHIQVNVEIVIDASKCVCLCTISMHVFLSFVYQRAWK